VGDVGNTLLAVPALADVGLAGVFFHELLGSREAATGDALADAAQETPGILPGVRMAKNLARVPAPHALYSAGPDLLRRIFAAAAGASHPTSIHVAEGEDEIQLLRDGTGRWAEILALLQVPAGSRTPRLGPLAYLESLGAFANQRPPLLVHMVCASPEDISRAHRHGAPGRALPALEPAHRWPPARRPRFLGRRPGAGPWYRQPGLVHPTSHCGVKWLPWRPTSRTSHPRSGCGLPLLVAPRRWAWMLSALLPLANGPAIIDVGPVDTQAPFASLVRDIISVGPLVARP